MTKNVTKADLLARIAALEAALEEDRKCLEAANQRLQSENERLKKEVEDYKSYVQGCSEMIKGDGPLAVKIERLSSTYYEMCQDIILAADLIQPGFQGDIHQLIHDETLRAASSAASQGRSTVTDVKVDREKIPGAMSWLIRYLDLGAWDPEFLANFTLYTNEARTRLVIIPNAWSSQAKKFVEAAMAAKYRREIKGNYWGTGRGFWLEVPVKK